MLINKKVISKTIRVYIFLFALYPILPNPLKGIIFYSFIFISLINFILYFKSRSMNKNLLIINILFFISYLISFFWTEDYKYGFRVLEKILPVILYSITFFFFLYTNKQVVYVEIKRKFIIIYILSSSIFSLLILYTLINNNILNGSSIERNIHSLEYLLPLKMGMHVIYMSMYIGLALIFLFYLSLKENNIKNKLIYLVLFFINILTIFVLFRKGVILSLFILLFIYLIKNNTRKFIVISTLTIFSLLIIFISYNESSYIKNRVDDFFLYKKRSGKDSSTAIRYAIYECSFEKIKANFSFGYGIGDFNNELMQCLNIKSPHYHNLELNSHNQYLSILLTTGFFGLFFFGIIVFYYFKLAIKLNDNLLLIILIYFLLIFLTENVLERNYGSRLFFFIINFFTFISLNKYKIEKE